MSQKKARQEPKAKVPSRGILRLEMEPEPTRVDSDEDEDSIVQLCPRRHRTRGPTIAIIEEAPKGLTEEQVTGSEPVPTPVTVETASSTSLQGRRKHRPKGHAVGFPNRDDAIYRDARAEFDNWAHGD